jgi:hypothetical protein
MITLNSVEVTENNTSKIAEVCEILSTYSSQLVASNGTPYYEIWGETASYWFYVNESDVNIKQFWKTVENLSHDKFLIQYKKKGA